MIITTFKSVNRAYVDQEINLPWADMAELLSTHFPADKKEDVPLYNLVKFKDARDEFVEPGRRYHYQDGLRQETYDTIPGTVRRCKGNVLEIHGVVLDVDDDMDIDSIRTVLDGLEYLLYTTFRHSPAKNKFRVIIPFSQPLLAEDVAGRQESIIETLPSVDRCSFTMSQSFYFHSGNDESRQVIWNKGVMINPYDFEYREPKVYVANDNAEYTDVSDEYKQAIIISLMTCSGLHYAGSGSSNHAVLTLVSICRSLGLGFDDFDYICAHMAHPESQLVKGSVRRDAWTGWHGDRVRRETRDEFIKTYNGQRPIFPKKVDPRVEEIKKRYEVLNG